MNTGIDCAPARARGTAAFTAAMALLVLAGGACSATPVPSGRASLALAPASCSSAHQEPADAEGLFSTCNNIISEYFEVTNVADDAVLTLDTTAATVLAPSASVSPAPWSSDPGRAAATAAVREVPVSYGEIVLFPGDTARIDSGAAWVRIDQRRTLAVLAAQKTANYAISRLSAQPGTLGRAAECGAGTYTVVQGALTMQAEDAIGFVVDNAESAPAAAAACRALLQDLQAPPRTTGVQWAADLRAAANPAIERPFYSRIARAANYLLRLT